MASAPVAAPATAAAPIGATRPASGAITPPALQLQPVLLRVAAVGGTQAVTVSLHPGELGQVQVRVERGDAGAMQVALTAERPETLHALIRDQSQLNDALDRAGVPEDGRSLTFHLAQPESSAAPPAPPFPSLPPSGSGGSPQSHDGAALAGGGTGEGQNQGGQGDGRYGAKAPGADGTELPPGDAGAEPQGARWLRLGIDITA